MCKNFLCGNFVFMIAFTLAIYLFPQVLFAKQTIQWLWFEQAPYFVGKNPRVGIGIGDELTRYLQDNLPEYEHQNIRVNTIRYNSMIKQENVCVPVAWLSENERQFLVHTRPHTLEPPAGIYVHQRNQQQFGDRGKVLSIKSLLENRGLKLGALRGMEYSQEVDQLLVQNDGRKNLLLIDAPMIEINLNLLKLERLDYLLGLPAQKKMLNNRDAAEAYIFYNIREIATYVPMYAHCSNSRIGMEIIQKLNKLLTNQRLIQSIEHYEHWYEGSEGFRKIFMDYIINRKSNSLVADM